ncbi:MAG: ROK family protein [Firmicutes bacterium]|nr:ROK family protein [Candidatus Colivicinus equi]
MRLGGIELGGTKMVCAISNENGEVLDRYTIPTTTPEETLPKLLDYFKDKNIDSLGIGSFGPVDLNKNSDTYGYITTTPKPGWANTDVVGYFKQLNVPIGFDTDVNVACLGEVTYGAGKDIDSVIYGTIGTGIGFGVYLDGRLVHGLMHTETGHMLLSKHEKDKDFVGPCPFHDNCFESLASGPSIEKRYGTKAENLYDRDDVWQLEAYYIGQALCNCVMCYSPKKIILGGGVMHNEKLFEFVRKETLKDINGYIKKDEILNHIDEYIVSPKLGDNAGILGACELGRLELAK